MADDTTPATRRKKPSTRKPNELHHTAVTFVTETTWRGYAMAAAKDGIGRREWIRRAIEEKLGRAKG